MIKKVFLLLLVAGMLMPVVTFAETSDDNALANVCTKISPLTKSLLKNTWPGHIYPPDPRSYGFAFICGRSSAQCPSRWPARVYYSDGTLAFKLGYYGTWSGNGGRPRAYTGTHGARTVKVKNIVKASKAKGKDGKKRDGYVYIRIKGKKCASAIPGKRNGRAK